MEKINERIKNLRKSAGITQTELAEALGVHLQTVSKWERGISEPDVAQMSELSSALGVSLEKLFGTEEVGQTFSGTFSAERLGEYISSLRIAQNESQQQLAQICEASADAVSRWERGVTCPDLQSLKILSAHFNVPVSKLYYAVPDEVAAPVSVKAGKKHKTVAIFASALAAAILAAATTVTALALTGGFKTESLGSVETVQITVDGVVYTVNKDEWYMPQADEKTGYDFVGWKDEEGELVSVPYRIQETVAFYAAYAPHEYQIEYWLNGGFFGTAEAQASFTVESGAVELPVPDKSGAVFEGWFLTDDYSGDAVTQITCGAQNALLYAKWSDEVYTVRYELNGGILYESNPDSVTAANAVALNNPLRIGYRFLGWYDAQDGGNRVTAVGGANAKNLTLYAQWQKSEEAFTIRYELNGGSQGTDNPNRVKVGEMVVLSNPTKRGHSFVG